MAEKDMGDNSLAVGQELPKLLTRVRSPVIASAYGNRA